MKKIFGRIFILFFIGLFTTGGGYKGSLPDISTQFEYLQTTPKAQSLFLKH